MYKFKIYLAYIRNYSFEQNKIRKNAKIFESFVKFYGFNSLQRSNLARRFLQKEIALKQNFDIPSVKKIPTSNNPYRKKKPPVPVARRLIKLDKLFLEKITDLIATSEYGSEVLENKIEITQAQVQIGYSAIHVFWTSQDNKYQDEKINNLFVKIAPFIRHELIQLNVFGRVPPIIFIKDVSSDYMAEIDNRLAVADFGEDYQPSVSYNYTSVNQVVQKQLTEEILNSLNQKSKEIVDNEAHVDEFEETLPELGQSIYGLHRDRIMNVIITGMKSSKGEHRKTKEELDVEHQRRFVSPVIVKSSSFMHVDGTRTSDIRHWAKQFRVKKMKIMKQNVTVDDERNQLLEEGDHEIDIYDPRDKFKEYDDDEDESTEHHYEKELR